MPPTQPGVYLYEDSNFGGASKFFTQDCPNLVSLGFNDKTSSIRVIGPYSAIVFGDVNYGGWAYTYRTDTPYVGNEHNDQISSLKVVPKTEEDQLGLHLYEHADFCGRWLYLNTTELNLVNRGFNDILSSFRIVGPYRVTFFEDINLVGRRSTAVGLDVKNIADMQPYTWQPTPPLWIEALVNLPPPPPEWSLASPRDIGNDQASSVAITTLDRYDYSSRLVWPQGEWSMAVPGGESPSMWKFLPDGSYSWAAYAEGVFIFIGGNYRLVGDEIVTFNNNIKDINNKVLSPAADATYAYRYTADGNAIDVTQEFINNLGFTLRQNWGRYGFFVPQH